MPGNGFPEDTAQKRAPEKPAEKLSHGGKILW